MVSRSLEKMMLIAIGLTTVVLVGVPVLFYTMETLSNVSELERAQSFADKVHNITGRVDLGQINNTSMEIVFPQYVNVDVSGNTLTVTYAKEGADTFFWSNTYIHPISITPPQDSGIYILSVSLEAGEVQLVFTPL